MLEKEDIKYQEVDDVAIEYSELTKDEEKRSFDESEGEKEWSVNTTARVIFNIPINAIHKRVWEPGQHNEGTEITTKRPSWIPEEDWKLLKEEVAKLIDLWVWD